VKFALARLEIRSKSLCLKKIRSFDALFSFSLNHARFPGGDKFPRIEHGWRSLFAKSLRPSRFAVNDRQKTRADALHKISKLQRSCVEQHKGRLS
jgi:hypothetical protein